MCKALLVWIVMKEEETVAVGVGVCACVQYIRDSQQTERDGPRVREQVSPPRTGLSVWA